MSQYISSKSRVFDQLHFFIDETGNFIDKTDILIIGGFLYLGKIAPIEKVVRNDFVKSLEAQGNNYRYPLDLHYTEMSQKGIKDNFFRLLADKITKSLKKCSDKGIGYAITITFVCFGFFWNTSCLPTVIFHANCPKTQKSIFILQTNNYHWKTLLLPAILLSWLRNSYRNRRMQWDSKDINPTR